MSVRIVAEDLLRESGYMLPQGARQGYLQELLTTEKGEGFPKDAVEDLLGLLPWRPAYVPSAPRGIPGRHSRIPPRW